MQVWGIIHDGPRSSNRSTVDNGSCLNPYVSLTEIAKEKKTSNPSYLIQSWMRSNTTVEYLRMWEKTYNPKFQDDACDELIHTVHTTGTTLTPSL